MSNELCILFAYHKLDELTIKHFELLKQHNPRHHIIPITDKISKYLPGTIDVNVFHDPWAKAFPWRKTHPWRRCDTMLYRWFMNRTISAERYLLLEYDCLCTVDVADAYADVWNADVAARDFYIPGQGRHPISGEYVNEEWPHFQDIGKLPSADRPYAAGLSPVAGMFFSHHGLQSIVRNATRSDVFCELRLGTAARKAGLNIVEFPPSLKQTIWWDPYPFTPQVPGVYHAIKPKSSGVDSDAKQSTLGGLRLSLKRLSVRFNSLVSS